jgi:membrane protease YdiL (CAAX protease family)
VQNITGQNVKDPVAVWELVSIVMTVLIIEWCVIPFAGRSSAIVLVPMALALMLLIFSARIRGETRRELGLRFDNFIPAMRRLLLPMGVGIALLMGVGWWLREAGFGQPRSGRWLLKATLWGVLWGLLQQYVLQSFVNRRAQIVFGRGARSILLVALVFALLHAPNLWLSVATFVGGLMWGYVYQQTPNLFALAISHGLMTWVLISSIPAPLLKGMRAGYNYFI